MVMEAWEYDEWVKFQARRLKKRYEDAGAADAAAAIDDLLEAVGDGPPASWTPGVSE